MQKVKILVDGNVVYSGDINENAKIDIQKTPKIIYDSANPRGFDNFENNIFYPMRKDYFWHSCGGTMWYDKVDNCSVYIKIPNAQNLARLLGLID